MTDTAKAPPPTSASRGAGRPTAPLWLLALLTFSGTVAMHVFVPALTVAGADLGAPASAMQMTISLYIAGLAVGQLLYGPLSDRFGRRPVLMAGLALYTAAGLFAAFAPDVDTLIAARLFQALGGCAGLVLGRAMVRDTAGEGDTARRLALMNLMVTLGPGVAPLIGGVIADSAGWRALFWLMGGLGVVNLLLTWRLVPETVTAAPGGAGAVARNYGRLLKSPAFLAYALGGACATTSVYAYVAAAPFVFVHELGRPPVEVGIYLALLILGIWIGSVLASILVSRIEARLMLAYGNGLSALAAFVFLGAVLADGLSVPLVVGALSLFTLGMGIASPAAMTRALGVDPAAVGSASGLYGSVQMAVGALCAALAALGSPALSAALVLAIACVVAQIAFRFASNRRP
ncbi:multidrug effflux MFS transporter [Zavarzinia compransoris]|uniref:multidrug effflux MFS transporter n=1 Tax=Zavarzinia marina TaxID=2911065 RepID=UPI001F15E429|nr:multidrug effflux MFS transporter [Zavarzinia marina]MCF4167496.1 multidrug effflux MFS transporter [Zavarzinia marina]